MISEDYAMRRLEPYAGRFAAAFDPPPSLKTLEHQMAPCELPSDGCRTALINVTRAPWRSTARAGAAGFFNDFIAAAALQECDSLMRGLQ
jgi:hypothetical protein